MISRSRTGTPVFVLGRVFLGKAIKKAEPLLNPAFYSRIISEYR